jgi:2-polyprenyl-6-methoxyphenol hydroxylase-like FAD-dependent oxidoreductase
MMSSARKPLPVLVAGGGIGGLAAALALARQGCDVKVLEQSTEIGEIGAGVQLGPNAFAAFDALGVGEQARGRAVYTERMELRDAIDGSVVCAVPFGAAFRARFGNPYAVMHRADVHRSLLEGVQQTARIELLTHVRVDAVEAGDDEIGVIDASGHVHRGSALIGCDGVKSAVRRQFVGDPVRVSGHVVYRAVIERAEFPDDLRINAPVVWAGPNCHLVHYPLRGGEQFNVVVTFHSRRQEEWSVTEGSAEEVQSYFEGIGTQPRQLLGLPKAGSAGPPPTANRSRSGPSAAPRCSETRRIRCCNTWRKAPAWRSRTPSRSARRCACTAARSSRRSRTTNVRASRAPLASC